MKLPAKNMRCDTGLFYSCPGRRIILQLDRQGKYTTGWGLKIFKIINIKQNFYQEYRRQLHEKINECNQ